MPGILFQALEQQQVTLVAINEVKFVAFPSIDKGVKGLGTRGLSACTVVILASPCGAILAHIGPDVLGSTPLDSYIRLTQSKMDEVLSLYHLHLECFASDTKKYVIIGTNHGDLLTEQQRHIVINRINAMGSDVAEIHRPLQPEVGDDRPEGTAVVFGGSGLFRVLLEDQDITHAQPGTTTEHRFDSLLMSQLSESWTAGRMNLG